MQILRHSIWESVASIRHLSRVLIYLSFKEQCCRIKDIIRYDEEDSMTFWNFISSHADLLFFDANLLTKNKFFI